MNFRQLISFALILGLNATLGAADPAPQQGAPPAAGIKPAAPPAEKAALQAAFEYVVVRGKVVVGNSGGAKTVGIAVIERKGGSLRVGDALNGKTLAVVGKKAAQVEARGGQEITVNAFLRENRTQLDVITIVEKPLPLPPNAMVNQPPKPKPKLGNRAIVLGKIKVVTDKNKKKTVSIAVTRGKGYDAAEGAVLQGKTLTIVGPKLGEAQALDGQQVQLIGDLKAENTQIAAESISPMKSGKPAAKPAKPNAAKATKTSKAAASKKN